MKPTLFVITGSNGAGKSTVGASYLPPDLQKEYSFFDGDKLSLEKRKQLLTTIKSIKEARNIADGWVQKEFLQKVKKAIAEKDHFAYEGHFRDKRTLNIPRKFKKNGYYLSIIFMGLPDTQESELRVIDRAKMGGHNVPLYEIEANFYGNLVTMNNNFKLFDEIIIVDTYKRHKVLFHMRNMQILTYSLYEDLPPWFKNFLPRLVKLSKDLNF